jgi:3'-phosphoadenosine 5'-phosphosulfate sulfotransferase (PAPS reductase)/FAD synthetase
VSPLDRHEKIALCFSGGKDSRACVEMFKHQLDKITIYNMDTGDLLPEMQESIARVEAIAPNFVRVKRDVTAWIEEHGLPSDLIPYTAHPVGQLMGDHKHPLISRYDCCFANLMWPLYERIKADGNTLMIRGTKRIDMRRLPAESGEIVDGVEMYLPLQDWTNEQVFAFLELNKVPLPRIYDYVVNSPECARCSAWWGERRSEYLHKYYPEIWRDYDRRLQVVIDEIAPSLALLRCEAGVG